MRRRVPVVAAAGGSDATITAQLRCVHVLYEDLPLHRAALNPWVDTRTIFAIFRWLRRSDSRCILAYTAKPVIYGLLAAAMAGVPRRVAMITGLGYAFTDGGGWSRWLIGQVVQMLYRLSLRRAHWVIFQNPDDRAEFIRRALVKPERAMLVAGSGVHLGRYAPAPLPAGPLTFLLIARLLRDKGIGEFVAAAKRLRHDHPAVRFRIVGPLDPNPTALTRQELQAWVDSGNIEWPGSVDDVRPEIAACHVYVLPSFYREGTPRTVLEAMAMARPIITTDAPGCRETVVNGVNGFLVPPRDVDSLVIAMQRFIDEPSLITPMGTASRRLAEARFDVRTVNARIMAALGIRPGHHTTPS